MTEEGIGENAVKGCFEGCNPDPKDWTALKGRLRTSLFLGDWSIKVAY